MGCFLTVIACQFLLTLGLAVGLINIAYYGH